MRLTDSTGSGTSIASPTSPAATRPPSASAWTPTAPQDSPRKRCHLDRNARVAKLALFKAYVTWCEGTTRRPLAATRFNRRLAELHHLDHVSSKGRDYWVGITLREE